MPSLSTESKPPWKRPYPLGIAGFFLLSCGLLAYLFTPALPAGDGAAYLDQVIAGDLGHRTLHLGYLVQLWVWVLIFGEPGAPLMSAAWGVAAVLAAGWAGLALVPPGRSRWLALAAPAVLLGASSFWTHALFPEVYGPAAAALLGAAALRLHGRAPAAALLAGVAVTMHPGVIAWIPALAWLGERERPVGRLGFAAGALVLPLAVALLSLSDFVMGDRGLREVLAWPEPWNAVQRAYRSLAGAYPLTGVILLAGLFEPGARRRLLAPLALGSLLTLAIDWRDDVPAHLPLVLLAALLAPPAVARLRAALGAPRAVLGVVALLAAAQVGEATSRHDRARRIADRDVAVLRELARDETPPAPWGTFGERARYDHYVDDLDVARHVQLPPGQSFSADACPDQRARRTSHGQVFVCPVPPGAEP